MTNKLTHEDYIQRVNNLVGEEYAILEKYVDTKTKLLTRHNVCKREWKICPNKFLGGRRCPKCNFELQAKRQKKSFQEVCKEVLERTNGEFEVIGGEYKCNKSKVLFLHKKCKNQFWMSVSNLLTRKLCPLCNKVEVSKKIRKTHEQFVEDIYKLYGNEYSVVGKYVRCIEKISIMHNICLNTWDVLPDNILRGFGCPHCDKSKGEREIEKILKHNDIVFSFQKTFDDCVGSGEKKLKFDFCVYDCSGNILFLVEFQGRQHFEEVGYFGGKDAFMKQQMYDIYKKYYCHKRDIKLVIISHTEINNIECILLKELNLLRKEEKT
jgi:hypothetical protein